MARPRKDAQDSRRKVYPLRLNAAERAALEAAAAARQTSPADFLRRAFLAPSKAEAPPFGGIDRLPVPVPALDPAAISALNRIGANLNQLARRANSGDSFQPAEVPEVLAALGQTLTRIEALVFPNLE
jgi:hypothetical protein